MSIPAKYEPELIDAKTKQGWLNWSLNFFTDPNILQVPYLDITIQLDVTEAYAAYNANQVPGSVDRKIFLGSESMGVSADTLIF